MKEDLARSAIAPINMPAAASAGQSAHKKHGSSGGAQGGGGAGGGGGVLEKADIQPMQIDQSISWDSIGGLTSHIKALKEMVLFPLLYPEVFARFAMTPPRGVLFYGPPGTGMHACLCYNFHETVFLILT